MTATLPTSGDLKRFAAIFLASKFKMLFAFALWLCRFQISAKTRSVRFRPKRKQVAFAGDLHKRIRPAQVRIHLHLLAVVRAVGAK